MHNFRIFTASIPQAPVIQMTDEVNCLDAIGSPFTMTAHIVFEIIYNFIWINIQEFSRKNPV